MCFMRILRVAVCCVLFLEPVWGQKKIKENKQAMARHHWVDSVFNSLSREEKIGQLLMVPAYSGGKKYNEDSIRKMLLNHQIGGLIFMQGTASHQAALTNSFQQSAQVPLLIAMDAEWGLGMRLDSVKRYPRQMMLGAARDTALVYAMGVSIARQCKLMGVHINFAPDIDVNNNPANPVINSRSFGEYKYWVARLGIAYMKGMQNNGVIACAKHFPGHGNTQTDSHKDLPLITQSLPSLDTMELVPFKALFACRVKSVMTAHLELPALDTTPHLPSSLSYPVVTELLKQQMGYQGLIVTDALDMEGVNKFFPPGEAELRAFKAGNDILLFSQSPTKAIARISQAIDSGMVPVEQLNNSVKKILYAKYDAGLAHFTTLDTNNLVNLLNADIDSFRAVTAKRAITLVSDNNHILPTITKAQKIAYIGINTDSTAVLFKQLKAANPAIQGIWLPKNASKADANRCIDSLQRYATIITAVHNLNLAPAGNYGLNDNVLQFLIAASMQNNNLIILLGNAYTMQYCCGAQSVIVGYEDDSVVEAEMAKMLLLAGKPMGKLPVFACKDGKSIVPKVVEKPATTVATPLAKKPTQLNFSATETQAGVINRQAIDSADSFISRCIAEGAFPGCQILASRNGNMFYHKAIGYANYEKIQPTDTGMLYDLASCTKILATTLAIMRLQEQDKIDLNATLDTYLPLTVGTNKAKITLQNLLLHQAGLVSWIPFYTQLLNSKGKIKKGYVKKSSSKNYSVQIANECYLWDEYRDSMWLQIMQSPLSNAGKSVYSDLDFLLLAKVVEQVTGQPINQYVYTNFYQPMGLTHTLYQPLQQFDSNRIIPTEWDNVFRKQQIRGYVHDPCAAMLGGVAGHAGLFSTAAEVGAIMQMLLQQGSYAGKPYFKPATIAQFTRYGSLLNHRGLGFDKPATTPNDGGPAGSRCSAAAFGHQGFTGTCAWADPETGIVFVFLSNRVNPSASNTLINTKNVRTTLQDYMYEALGLPINTNRIQLYNEQVKR
ncbi:MAG: hypothetical protein EBX41_05770 [Chitinophagia bacterium]|nr:hypothetical protein [Chitinophagia bacterium]